MANRAEFGVTLALDLVGAATALLVSTRPWQTVVTHRPRPLADTVLHVSGRTVDAAPTALAIAALAGVVAVLATRGYPRRLIGALLALDGVALVWRSFASGRAISVHRAQALVASKHPGIALVSGTHIDVQAVWPSVSAAAGVFVALAGALLVVRGHRWEGMSARYESPAGQARQPDQSGSSVRGDANLWAALERGEDPTAGERSID